MNGDDAATVSARLRSIRPHSSVVALLAMMIVALTATRAAGAPPPPDHDAVDYAKLADDVDAYWKRIILAPWYPRCVDATRGGFNSGFDAAWKPTGRDPGRLIVFQSRMTFAASRAAMVDDLREKYLPHARHGLDYLHDAMWDDQHGGFFWQVKADRSVDVDLKTLYGQAFGLYASAAAYRATQDPRALDLAQRSFWWLEDKAHDARNGGYREMLNRAGRPATKGDRPERGLGAVGQKSTNGQLHAIEALTELYRAWPDPLVRERIAGMLTVLRDRMFREPGYLVEVLTDDWTPVSTTASYGHDIEGAHLLYGAAEAIGMADDPQVRAMCRALVDNVMKVGIDPRDGGVFGGGTPSAARDKGKTWWAQYESANALLLMHELYGDDTPAYLAAFRRQWRMINTKITARTPPGVRGGVRPDGQPFDGPRGTDWKAAYHETRCLTEMTERLRRLAARN